MRTAQRVVVVERSCFDFEPGTRGVLIVLYLDIEPMVADMYRRNLGMLRGANIQAVAVGDQ